jgi:hypothetical protein
MCHKLCEVLNGRVTYPSSSALFDAMVKVKKLTSRRRLKPETPGHSYQVFLNVLRIQDIAHIVQSGPKHTHLLEQAMNRVFNGCVAIEIVKYSAENKASNKRTELL